MTVDRRKTKKERHFFGPRGPHGVSHFKRKPHPAGKITAVGVIPLIAETRKETVNQVTVRAVYLEHLKTHHNRPAGTRRKRLDGLGNLRLT